MSTYIITRNTIHLYVKNKDHMLLKSCFFEIHVHKLISYMCLDNFLYKGKKNHSQESSRDFSIKIYIMCKQNESHWIYARGEIMVLNGWFMTLNIIIITFSFSSGAVTHTTPHDMIPSYKFWIWLRCDIKVKKKSLLDFEMESWNDGRVGRVREVSDVKKKWSWFFSYSS